jgi:hypothetical protein
MSRRIELNLFGVSDLGVVADAAPNAIQVRLFERGAALPSGRGVYKENAACLSIEGVLPDKYEDRIEYLITALGGEEAVADLIVALRPRTCWVRIIVPARTSPSIEEGALSAAYLGKLARLGLGLEFWYT